jgi:hypothetical protein
MAITPNSVEIISAYFMIWGLVLATTMTSIYYLQLFDP